MESITPIPGVHGRASHFTERAVRTSTSTHIQADGPAAVANCSAHGASVASGFASSTHFGSAAFATDNKRFGGRYICAEPAHVLHDGTQWPRRSGAWVHGAPPDQTKQTKQTKRRSTTRQRSGGYRPDSLGSITAGAA